ncbi:DUF1853 family protein [Muriicola marianensis]|uniref:DUF1853 family protein n=1 Tax=Muriicola marianensis TaxID=1324801 RepID=A0ABQ1QQM5_9FLAO|nr:DUF1853 family protein [Muriicola marianensis]GGD38616.1 hypothetical protein GCM10011361_02200 [Muriicola marianensis]
MKDRFTDLAKAFLQTPPLWTRSQFGMEQFQLPEIDLSAVRPETFSSGMRLGHKMERIFLSLLKGQETYGLIGQNILVRRDKITLGEIDFLLRHIHEDRAVHVELTYKFYLVDTDISEPIYQLVGPNRKDMFFTKLDKLKEGQFSLPYSEEGTKVLEAMGLHPANLDQKVCFKAQLFIPYSAERVGIRPLNTRCVVGSWMRMEDFESPAFRDHEYYFPAKEEWVLNSYDTDSWMPYYDTLLELNLRMIKQHSTLVWMKKANGEFEKFFVVWW